MKVQNQIDVYRDACQKAAAYQKSFLLPDGGYIWEGYPEDAFHKQAYAWQLFGYRSEAERLLNWVKANKLQSDGQLKEYKGDMYKHAWFFQGAHKLGRFDLSYPVISYMLSCQAPCGGFPHFAGNDLVRALSTAWSGVSFLLFGDLKTARRIAECCMSMVDQQPDDNRFYFKMSLDGKLVTEKDHPNAEFIDTEVTKQFYWEAGFILILMCRMYQATGDRSYLDYAGRVLEFKLRCREDSFSYWGSGKSALGAALYYSLTGDIRAKEAALKFCDFVVDTQRPEGGFRYEDEPDELIIYVDHAACFTVWAGETIATLEGVDGLGC